MNFPLLLGKSRLISFGHCLLQVHGRVEKFNYKKVPLILADIFTYDYVTQFGQMRYEVVFARDFWKGSFHML